MAYRIEFTPQADEHLTRLTARERATLFDQLDRQLVPEPTVETRNRKRMEPARPWLHRALGASRRSPRVYYEVSDDPAPVVTVRAIGVKVRNRVRIGDEWWEPGKAQEAARSDEDPGDGTGQG